ncbi:hypothetical protein [Acrocarpospora catenulata]|uniref:hypothetical protein n=1 Tax=Acrocarpospora catenulata TaxID=2836182 RepID=UPI001BDA1529|nr:hypothetical protein [Acrocarpospora catenulata]
MDVRAIDVIRELKTLRQGFAFGDPGVTKRIGPALSQCAGVTSDDGPNQQSRKIYSFLLRMAERLPPAAAELSRWGLALERGSGWRLERRVKHVSRTLRCHPRTVHRRLNSALEHLAYEITTSPLAGQHVSGDGPWQLEWLKTSVLITSSQVEIVEERGIVSRRDGLVDIDQSYSLADSYIAELDFEVLRGGTRLAQERLSTTRTGFRVRLSRPLQQHEGHELAIKVVMNGGTMPFYVCTPRYPCARFELTVRFAAFRPGLLWVVDNELPLEVGDPLRCDGVVRLNEEGEATVAFAGLEANRSYGLAWLDRMTSHQSSVGGI